MTKNEVGITKKLLGVQSKNFFCVDCLADFFEVKSQEIIFTSGGTESDHWAIKFVALEHLSERP